MSASRYLIQQHEWPEVAGSDFERLLKGELSGDSARRLRRAQQVPI